MTDSTTNHQLLIKTREDVANLNARMAAVEKILAKVDDRLDHIESQLTYGKGMIGAGFIFASLVGAGFSFLFQAFRQAILSGGGG